MEMHVQWLVVLVKIGLTYNKISRRVLYGNVNTLTYNSTCRNGYNSIYKERLFTLTTNELICPEVLSSLT